MILLNIFYFATLLICISVNGLDILQICPGFSQSHILFNHKLAKTFHRAGHNVTLLNLIMMENVEYRKPPEGITEIRLEPDFPPHISKSMISLVGDDAFQKTGLYHGLKMGIAFKDLTLFMCQYILHHNELLLKLKERNFDVTLSHMFTLCPVGLNRMLNVPKLIWVSPGTFVVDHAASIMALPNLISYIPNTGGDYSDKMSFGSRIKNVFLYFFSTFVFKSKYYTFGYENDCFKQFSNDDKKFPDLWTLAADTQALLVNGEDFLDFPRPMTHGILYMGELEHKNVGVLSEEWQSIMENSKNGVILFSLGTVVNSSAMPQQLKNAFLEAFSNFKNYTIIWRLEGEKPFGLEQQKHIKIVTWVPQKELLSHPKFKLFITHGGYNSLLESSQVGVPMILIPLRADQYTNAQRAIRLGLGLMLDKFNVDGDVIKETISSILYNASFQINAKKFSNILRDKFIFEQIDFVKFVEKIVRTKNWPTMKAAQSLNFFQYYCLDVLLFVSFIVFLVVFFVFKVFILFYISLKRLK